MFRSKWKDIKYCSNYVLDYWDVHPIKIKLGFLGLNRTQSYRSAVTNVTSGTRPYVTLDVFLFLFFPMSIIQEVLIHELAHVIDFYRNPSRINEDGHGITWQIIVSSMGIKPNPSDIYPEGTPGRTRVKWIIIFYTFLISIKLLPQKL